MEVYAQASGAPIESDSVYIGQDTEDDDEAVSEEQPADEEGPVEEDEAALPDGEPPAGADEALYAEADEAEPPTSFKDEAMAMRTGDTDEEALFTVTCADGLTILWNEGDLGSVTLGYHQDYDPEQTFRVACKSEWTLFDPEGMLSEVYSDGEGTVYAMRHPTWEQPCLFTSGDAVMPLYVFFPNDGVYSLVLYDTSLPQKDWLPIVTLSSAQRKPGQEVDIAYLCAFGFNTVQARTNPLEAIGIEGPASARHEPGALFYPGSGGRGRSHADHTTGHTVYIIGQ